MADKIPMLHQFMVSKIILTNKSHVIEPKTFKRLIGGMFHIEKEYSLIILKELEEYGLIKEYSGKEIIFNKKSIDRIFM